VQEFFAALRGMLKPLLAGNSLELTFEAAAGIPALYIDEGKISQILRNLISNALKFTRKGFIRVTADAEDGGSTVTFRVADTGIGIAPEDQERIFEEFVQVEGELQSKLKGTGLGLPLSRKLAELLRGSLQVESVPDMGSTFTVRPPTIFGQAPPTPLTLLNAVRELIEGQSSKTILLVDDDEVTRYLLGGELARLGYRIQEAHGGREAIRQIWAKVSQSSMLPERSSVATVQ
jgi:hypothetical protein